MHTSFFQIRDDGRGRGTAVPEQVPSSGRRRRQQFCRITAYDTTTDNNVVTVAAAISPSTTSRESLGTICNVTARMAVDHEEPTAHSAPFSTANRNIPTQLPSVALSAYDMFLSVLHPNFLSTTSNPQTHFPRASRNASNGLS